MSFDDNVDYYPKAHNLKVETVDMMKSIGIKDLSEIDYFQIDIMKKYEWEEDEEQQKIFDCLFAKLSDNDKEIIEVIDGVKYILSLDLHEVERNQCYHAMTQYSSKNQSKLKRFFVGIHEDEDVYSVYKAESSHVCLRGRNVEKLMEGLDLIYYSGYGQQYVSGFIVFKNGTWIERSEYDGSERWSYQRVPTIDEEGEFYGNVCSESVSESESVSVSASESVSVSGYDSIPENMSGGMVDSSDHESDAMSESEATCDENESCETCLRTTPMKTFRLTEITRVNGKPVEELEEENDMDHDSDKIQSIEIRFDRSAITT